MITKQERDALLSVKVAQVQDEIREHVAAGIVPTTAVSFSELHDYVDANCYGGFCDDDEVARLEALWGGTVAVGMMMDATPPDLQDFMNEVQNAADAWIRNGGLRKS